MNLNQMVYRQKRQFSMQLLNPVKLREEIQYKSIQIWKACTTTNQPCIYGTKANIRTLKQDNQKKVIF
ncbi:hypothetical protein HanIR_Chr10g0460481 [Helianthus annuus]|nr:hypothetical protein HanIR_Chr10g0460481 [Helianthus annuus]